jgi:Long-chain acyl-CoA synthetases (AMP-forming)
MHTWEEIKPLRGKLYKDEWPTIAEIFMITLAEYPDNECFTVFNPNKESYTYKQIYDEIKRVSSYLIECGVKKGEKVILNGKNSIAWAIGYLSAQFAGAVIVPMDNQMHIDRLEALAEFADGVFVLADADVMDKLNENNPWYRNLKGKLTLQNQSDRCPNIFDVKPEMIHQTVQCNEDDVAAILFTSGTTGNEKGVMLTQKNISSDIYQAADGMGVNSTDTLYALLPLHHSYCCTAVLLESIKHGANCLFGHGIIVSRMIADMKKGHVTTFMGIPLLYNKILDGIMNKLRAQGKFKYGLIRSLMWINGTMKKYFHVAPLRGFFNKKILSNLGMDYNKILICGAGPLSATVFRQYQQFGLDFLQGYGLTEASPIVTLNPVKHFKVDSVGRVFPLDKVIIANADEQGVGEIRVKGPNVCLGYYKDKDNTDALFDENGYMKTGDLGYLDSENYVYIKGRLKNIIVTEGGKNIFPEEIEDYFQTISEVQQIVIRGYQKAKGVPCESVEAVIYPNPDRFKEQSREQVMARMEEIVKEVNVNLASYKKIEKITILDKPMEMTTTQKVKRNKIQG